MADVHDWHRVNIIPSVSVPAVKNYALQQGAGSLFSAHTGWLTKTSWDAVVNKVNELFGRLMP